MIAVSHRPRIDAGARGSEAFRQTADQLVMGVQSLPDTFIESAVLKLATCKIGAFLKQGPHRREARGVIIPILW
jgi:hypothetical protein